MMMKAPAGAAPREVFKVGVNCLISYLEGIVGRARLERRTICEDDKGGPALLR